MFLQARVLYMEEGKDIYGIGMQRSFWELEVLVWIYIHIFFLTDFLEVA